MKVKLLKKFRKQAKEEVYLTHYYSEDGKISIILKKHDAPFGLTTYFYNRDTKQEFVDSISPDDVEYISKNKLLMRVCALSSVGGSPGRSFL